MSRMIPRATSWHDSSDPVQFVAPARAPGERWAVTPYKGRRGRYVAIRQVGEQLEVAIAEAPRVRWLAAALALNAVELEAWLKTGF